MPKAENKIYLYVKDGEKQLVEAAAESLGLSISSYIRMVILKDARTRLEKK